MATDLRCSIGIASRAVLSGYVAWEQLGPLNEPRLLRRWDLIARHGTVALSDRLRSTGGSIGTVGDDLHDYRGTFDAFMPQFSHHQIDCKPGVRGLHVTAMPANRGLFLVPVYLGRLGMGRRPLGICR